MEAYQVFYWLTVCIDELDIITTKKELTKNPIMDNLGLVECLL